MSDAQKIIERYEGAGDTGATFFGGSSRTMNERRMSRLSSTTSGSSRWSSLRFNAFKSNSPRPSTSGETFATARRGASGFGLRSGVWSSVFVSFFSSR